MERVGRCVAGLALLAAVGCAGNFRSPTERWDVVSPGPLRGDVTMYRDIQFSDIPVPAAYSIIRQESYSFQGSLFRNGVLKYDGPVDFGYAVNFFRAQLPRRGWTLEKTEDGVDSRVLYFSKDQEKLIVIVRQLPGGSRSELQLDNVGKNDLLLKGRLVDPGYTAPPTYMQQR